ncbi:hypothetical protein SAMN05192585_10785 [Acetanaerobacterium elongatum]|uniref:Uncharacterized protein n=2 Tax=Acetanaerobacterium elongatum TaxID=258515 RepID=A0A1G9X4Q4_9FIRM|nr:hypothetical protein SAMN05192585_10785 [Acetanaerobacterium elongatum]
MRLILLNGEFAVCKLGSLMEIDFKADFVFFAKTDDELSLVCQADKVPKDAIATEADWKALKIEGVLDFSLTGVISAISSALAESKIPVFVVSTYNTDYVLVKKAYLISALAALRKIGCSIVE